MRVVMFCHSLLSDWNHGNAHFLRGVVSELVARGHDVVALEARNAWSLAHLMEEHGRGPLEEFRRAYPEITIVQYRPDAPALDDVLEDADLVLVHEWNEPSLVGAIGRHWANRRMDGVERGTLLFHDTHHRSVTRPHEIDAYDLGHYDGVLAFGDPVRDAYLRNGWTARAWTWHEAADVRRFHPQPGATREGDLVWIGNWGDDERAAELREFLIEPVRRLGIRARVYGVRYPEEAQRLLAGAGIEYGGWLPNVRVPDVFARFRLTIHVPRAPYVRALPGIPTIRPFEALACGIPLAVALWDTTGDLFTPGEDFLLARSGEEMEAQIRLLLDDAELSARLACRGRATILARHTCAHRVDALLAIHEDLRRRRLAVATAGAAAAAQEPVA